MHVAREAQAPASVWMLAYTRNSIHVPFTRADAPLQQQQQVTGLYMYIHIICYRRRACMHCRRARRHVRPKRCQGVGDGGFAGLKDKSVGGGESCCCCVAFWLERRQGVGDRKCTSWWVCRWVRVCMNRVGVGIR